MKSKLAEINKFDSCVKQALNKELKYRLRSIKNYRKHYVNISELSKADESKLFYMDDYPSDNFSEKLTTRLFEPSQQKWTQKSFKKRNESQYFVNLRKPTAFIPRFA